MQMQADKIIWVPTAQCVPSPLLKSIPTTKQKAEYFAKNHHGDDAMLLRAEEFAGLWESKKLSIQVNGIEEPSCHCHRAWLGNGARDGHDKRKPWL
jgi:hypothetical protein